MLLDFLLTHGPEDFAGAFQCDSDVIEELGTFRYVDEKGYSSFKANLIFVQNLIAKYCQFFFDLIIIILWLGLIGEY